MTRILLSLLVVLTAGLCLARFSRASKRSEVQASEGLQLAGGFLDTPLALAPGALFGTLTLSDHDLPPELLDELRLDFHRLDAAGDSVDQVRLAPQIMQRVGSDPPSWAFRTGTVEEGSYELRLHPVAYRTQFALGEARESIDLVVPPFARTLFEIDGPVDGFQRFLRVRRLEGHSLSEVFIHASSEPGLQEAISAPGTLVFESSGSDWAIQPRSYEALSGWNVHQLTLMQIHRLRVSMVGGQAMPAAWWLAVEIEWLGGLGEAESGEGELASSQSIMAVDLSGPEASFLDLGLRRAGEYRLGFPGEIPGEARPAGDEVPRRWVRVQVEPRIRNSLTIPIVERSLKSLELSKKEIK